MSKRADSEQYGRPLGAAPHTNAVQCCAVLRCIPDVRIFHFEMNASAEASNVHHLHVSHEFDQNRTAGGMRPVHTTTTTSCEKVLSLLETLCLPTFEGSLLALCINNLLPFTKTLRYNIDGGCARVVAWTQRWNDDRAEP